MESLVSVVVVVLFLIMVFAAFGKSRRGLTFGQYGPTRLERGR